MICVFNGVAGRDYTSLGDAVLDPISCNTHLVAAGSYELSMVHPIDPEGKWRLLIEDNIIKCPVQEETIENAYAGQEMWIYYTAGVAALRDDPSEPQSVNYREWSGETEYVVGSRVTYYGKAYRCTYFDTSSGQRFVPPNNSPWWYEIPNTTGGGKIVASLPAGTKLIWISGTYEDTWWNMSTFGGVTGWIKQAELTGEEHRTQEVVEPVRIFDQLFRIRTAEADNESMTVTVQAEHVSYDGNGLLVRNAEIAMASPAMALQLVQEGLFSPYTYGNISTNLTGTEDGTLTQSIKNKSLIACLLDPENGIVPKFRAAYKRNNWDLYVMKMQDTDRGFTIEYGINAKGIRWTRDRSSVVTHVIPIAKKENGEELFLDGVFVVSPKAALYPRPRMKVLRVEGQVGKDDGTNTDTVWTTETLLAEMQRQAEEQFSVLHVDDVLSEVSVDFVMLGDTDEYSELKRLQRANLYDIVKTREPRIGLDLSLRVTEIRWDAIKKRVTGLKLSNIPANAGQSISGFMLVNGSVSSASLSSQAIADLVDSAADKAVAILS